MSWSASRAAALAILLVASVTPGAAQQRALTTRSFQGLRLQVAQTTQMRGVLELRARWSPVSAQQRAQQVRDSFVLLDQRAQAGTLRRERRPELSADRLVVISVDSAGRELDWRLVINPRLVRAEVPGPDGRLSGGTFESPADLQFAIPDLPQIESVDIYQPVWTADGYVLSPLGTVRLTRQ